ncbi:hypothetical protein G9A89_001878 [Geosiphon pyriformis]|nr:hypothetical protein G9A89_001878 [Geosiphon pyriformis]
MAYLNALPFETRFSYKFPIQVEGEQFFYRYHPIKIRLSISKPPHSTPKTTHKAVGRIFLTDKRLIFIADAPSQDGFETFSLILDDITTSSRVDGSHSISRPCTFSLIITLTNMNIVKLDFIFKIDKKDLKAKETMQDYYGMMIDSITAAKRRKSLAAGPNTLESVTNLRVREQPPSYSRSFGIMEVIEPPSYRAAMTGLREDGLPPYSNAV